MNKRKINLNSGKDALNDMIIVEDIWKKFIETKENLAIKIKEIVENEKASFAFPSQSIYVESLPDDQKEIINLKQ